MDLCGCTLRKSHRNSGELESGRKGPRKKYVLKKVPQGDLWLYTQRQWSSVSPVGREARWNLCTLASVRNWLRAMGECHFPGTGRSFQEHMWNGLLKPKGSPRKEKKVWNLVSVADWLFQKQHNTLSYSTWFPHITTMTLFPLRNGL